MQCIVVQRTERIKVMRTRGLVVGLFVVVGCGRPPALTLLDAYGAHTAQLDTVLAAQPLAEGQNIAVQVLGRTEAFSSHLVQIRDRERPHIHTSHDLAVTLLRGRGRLFIAGEAHEMRSGDVAVVPHGTPHYFVNLDSHPAAAFVTFAPPYDGKDQVPVGE
jgi:quercetin dioxygenase-like cupin family protein